MTSRRSILCAFIFAGATGCTRAIAPGDPPRAPAREEASELELNASNEEVAGDAAAIAMPDACAVDEPVVSVSTRVAFYIDAAAPNIDDTTFTGPRAAARLRCAASLGSRARDRATDDGHVIRAKVLRGCDERPLPPVVRGSHTRAELVRVSTSSNGDDPFAILGLLSAPRSCVEIDVAISSTHRNPFASRDACETMRARLEAKDREEATNGKGAALAWLDEQIAKADDDVAKARQALAERIASEKSDPHEKLDRVEREMRRIEHGRLEATVRSYEKMSAMVRARRDEAARDAIVVDVKGTCVARGE